jgi:superfamily II DNA helicase RecQ
VPHLESEREGVSEITEKVKALIKRALEYSKDLILNTNSLIYLFKKDFLSLVLSPLLSLMVIMSRASLNNRQTPTTTINS